MILTCTNTGWLYTGTLMPRQWPWQSSFPLSNNEMSTLKLMGNICQYFWIKRWENHDKGERLVREHSCDKFSRTWWLHHSGQGCPHKGGECNPYHALHLVKIRYWWSACYDMCFSFVPLATCEWWLRVLKQRCVCLIMNTPPDLFWPKVLQLATRPVEMEATWLVCAGAHKIGE
jgi:hypothetical protein